MSNYGCGGGGIGPNNRKQYEWPAQLTFKITLRDEFNFYGIYIQEVETDVETEISTKIKTRTVAEQIFAQAIQNIISTGQYTMGGWSSGQAGRSSKSAIFKQKEMFIWSMPNDKSND